MKEVNKMKFVVMKGRDGTPGSVRCDYSIFDIFEVKSKNIKNEFKKYSFEKFGEMGGNVKTMEQDVSFHEKNIYLDDGKLFAEKVMKFQHTHSYFMFIPVMNFNL